MKNEIRALSLKDSVEIADHLMRLDKEARRFRFCCVPSDAYIQNYVSNFDWDCQILFGYLENNTVRAIVEVGWESWSFPRSGDLGMSVELPWRRKGVGSNLLNLTFEAARNRFVKEIHADCMAENKYAIALLRKFGFRFRYKGYLLNTSLELGWPEFQRESSATAKSFISNGTS